MTGTLGRSSYRYLLRHPWQFGLSVVGVALGVTVVVSVDLANESARRAFDLSTEAVTGRATHQVLGGPRGLEEQLFRRLRLELGVRRAAPIVEGYASLPDEPARVLRVLGVDFFSEPPFRSYLGGIRAELEIGPFLTWPGAVVASEETARRLQLALAESFEVQVGALRQQLTLVGLVDPADELTRQGLADLLVTDISTAQELLQMHGWLSRIDLIVDEGATGEELLERIRSMLPPAAEVIPAKTRSDVTQQMTRAFRVNLAALSLLALICGIFLVYNTISFSVVQRRSLLGALRALGVTRREVFVLVLSESLVVGLLGTGLGLAGGIALGRALLQLVTQTINDLYFVVSVREYAVASLSLLKGMSLGLGGALLAAIWPAREATAAPPRQVLLRSAIESRARRSAPRLCLSGSGLVLMGFLLLSISGQALVLSFGALFVIIIGLALVTPAAVVGLMWLARPPLQLILGTIGRLAARGVVAALSRTAVAIAALMIAISVIIGVGVMIDSFRRTVVRWLETSLRADLYVSAPSRGVTEARLALDAPTMERLESLPQVQRISTIRGIDVESNRGRTRLLAFDMDSRSHPSFDFKEGQSQRIWPAFEGGGAVIVSEPYAYRNQVSVGDTVRLRTDRGERDFVVAGIYINYASDQGLVTMSRATYELFWDDRAISGFSVYAAPGADLAVLRESIREVLGERQVVIQSNRMLREASLEVFDRTFLITGVLRLLVTLVAFIGVISALMALHLERGRELGVLRAVGLTPRQVWRLMTTQSGLIGLASGLLAIPAGLTLAAIMIFVINRRSFGWTLQMEVAPQILIQALVIALVAAVLAGIYPALQMSRTSPAVTLRDE